MKHLPLLVVALTISACVPSKEAHQMTMSYGLGVAVVDSSNLWTYQLNGVSTGIHPYPFDNGPDYFEEGLARFQEDGKMGYFAISGDVVIEPAYDFGAPFCGGFAAVCNGCVSVSDGEHETIEGGMWGHIDRTGKIVTPLKYTEDSLPAVTDAEC